MMQYSDLLFILVPPGKPKLDFFRGFYSYKNRIVSTFENDNTLNKSYIILVETCFKYTQKQFDYQF